MFPVAFVPQIEVLSKSLVYCSDLRILWLVDTKQVSLLVVLGLLEVAQVEVAN